MFPRSSTFIYKPYCSFLSSKISLNQHYFTTIPTHDLNKSQTIGQVQVPDSRQGKSEYVQLNVWKNDGCNVTNHFDEYSKGNEMLSNGFSYKKSRNQDDICLEDWLTCCPSLVQKYKLNPKENILNINRSNMSNSLFERFKFRSKNVKNFSSLFCRLNCVPFRKMDAIDSSILCSAKGNEKREDYQKGFEKWNDLPTDFQMDEMMSYFQEEGPKIFTKKGWSYLKCSYKIVFENCMIGTRTETLNSYIMQINVMKSLTKLILYNPELTIIRMAKDTSDGSIHIRWQVHGLPRYFVPFAFLGLVDERSSMKYIDGFSIFFMKNDGLYHRHLLIKMSPSRNEGLRNVFSQVFSNIMYRPTLRPSGLGANVSNEHTQK